MTETVMNYQMYEQCRIIFMEEKRQLDTHAKVGLIICSHVIIKVIKQTTALRFGRGYKLCIINHIKGLVFGICILLHSQALHATGTFKWRNALIIDGTGYELGGRGARLTIVSRRGHCVQRWTTTGGVCWPTQTCQTSQSSRRLVLAGYATK